MKLIFCLSNLFIPATLSLVSEAKNIPILIYTHQQGIYKFFNELMLPDVEVCYRDQVILKRNTKTIIKYISQRKQLLNYLEEFNFKELYFFNNTFGDLNNWLIRKLSNKAIVYFIPVFNNYSFKKKYSLESLKVVLRNLFLNNYYSIPLHTGKAYIYKTSNSFFKKIKTQNRSINIDYLYINNLICKTYNLNNKQIVLLSGAIVETDFVDKKEYITKINELIDGLDSKPILVKPHPRFEVRYGLEKELAIIPSHIPANILFTFFKVFIGYNTSTLSEAANYGVKSISLLDYFEPNSVDERNRYKKYLIKNLTNGRILFPKSKEEIISAILDDN